MDLDTGKIKISLNESSQIDEWNDFEYAWEVENGEVVCIIVDREEGTLSFMIDEERYPVAIRDPLL